MIGLPWRIGITDVFSKNNMLSNLVERVTCTNKIAWTLFVSTGLWGSLQALSTGRHWKICHSKLYAWTFMGPPMVSSCWTSDRNIPSSDVFVTIFSLQSQLHLDLWPVIWRGRLAIRRLGCAWNLVTIDIGNWVMSHTSGPYEFQVLVHQEEA